MWAHIFFFSPSAWWKTVNLALGPKALQLRRLSKRCQGAALGALHHSSSPMQHSIIVEKLSLPDSDARASTSQSTWLTNTDQNSQNLKTFTPRSCHLLVVRAPSAADHHFITALRVRTKGSRAILSQQNRNVGALPLNHAVITAHEHSDQKPLGGTVQFSDPKCKGTSTTARWKV